MSDEVLLLDIGNTRCKWAWQQGEVFIPGGELMHAGQLDADQLVQISLNHSPAKVVAVCVAGDTVAELFRIGVERQFGMQVEFITASSKGQGINNGYVEPLQLGSDRWAAMVAAHQRWPGYLCVIDAGSALTLDIVYPDGQHQGGYILPGLRMMQNCLLQRTAIPMHRKSVIMASNTRPGNDTASCIANGALQAACGLIERTVLHLEQKVEGKLQCVLTGGDSRYLTTALTIPYVVEPHLVLMGLAHIIR